MYMFFSGQMVKVLTSCDSLTGTVMFDKLLQALWGVVIYFEIFPQFERAEEHHGKYETIIFGLFNCSFSNWIVCVEAWMTGER
jgi:hypothetical protein